MALDPSEWLEHAERMRSLDDAEIAHRTAVNRAYYACHLAARDQLYGVDAHRQLGRRPSHIAVIRAVRAQLNEQAANRLHRLKLMREAADYIRDSDHPEVQAAFVRERAATWSDFAAAAIESATDLLLVLDDMPPGSAGERLPA